MKTLTVQRQPPGRKRHEFADDSHASIWIDEPNADPPYVGAEAYGSGWTHELDRELGGLSRRAAVVF
jgi:hypothetical protein